ILTGFLASKTLDNSTVIIREIHSALNPPKSTLQNQEQANQQQEQQRVLSSSQLHTISKQLRQSVAAIARALQETGVSPEESERIAYKVIFALWEDTPDALLFLRKITEKK